MHASLNCNFFNFFYDGYALVCVCVCVCVLLLIVIFFL